VDVCSVRRSSSVGCATEMSVGATFGRTSVTTYFSRPPSGVSTTTSSPTCALQSARNMPARACE